MCYAAQPPLHLTRLSCAVAGVAEPAVEKWGGGSSLETSRR